MYTKCLLKIILYFFKSGKFYLFRKFETISMLNLNNAFPSLREDS